MKNEEYIFPLFLSEPFICHEKWEYNGLAQEEVDIARKSMAIYTHVRSLQEVFTRLEKCRKPVDLTIAMDVTNQEACQVIACVHNACVGGGVDMITAADIRYCTQDAWFCVREVIKSVQNRFCSLTTLTSLTTAFQQPQIRDSLLKAKDVYTLRLKGGHGACC